MMKINDQNLHNISGSDSALSVPTANFYFSGKACHLERPGLKIRITGLRPNIRIEADVRERTLSLTIPRPAEIERLQFKKGSVEVKLAGLTFTADTAQFCGLRFCPMLNGDLQIIIPIPHVTQQPTKPPTRTAPLQDPNTPQEETQGGGDALVIPRRDKLETVPQAIRRMKKCDNPSSSKTDASIEVSGDRPSPTLPARSAKNVISPDKLITPEDMNVNNFYDAFKERCRELYDVSGASFGDHSNDPLAAEFIERIRLYALAVARRVIKGTDKRSDILDDAVQDATIQVLTKLHTFQEGAKFSVWAYTVVSNICKAAAKKGQCKIKTTRESEFGDGSEVTILDYITRDHRVKNDSYGWQSQNNTEADESRVILRNAINSLSTDHREILLLQMRGYEYEDIANQLQIKVGTVRSRLNRAKYCLKRSLKRTGVSELKDII